MKLLDGGQEQNRSPARGRGEELGAYSTYGEKPLESFRQGIAMRAGSDLEAHSGCWGTADSGTIVLFVLNGIISSNSHLSR